MGINKNQKGFSAIEVFLVLAVIAVITFASYFIYKSHHKSPSPIIYSSDNSSTSSEWLPYISKAGDFSAYFPTSPNFNKSPVASPNPITKTENGVDESINIVVSSNNINTTYSIATVTSPKSAKLPDLTSAFPGYINMHIKNSKITSIEGRMAETFELTAIRKAQPTDALGRKATIPATKIYDVGENIIDGKINYTIIAEHYGDTPAVNAQYFLNSFKLNN